MLECMALHPELIAVLCPIRDSGDYNVHQEEEGVDMLNSFIL